MRHRKSCSSSSAVGALKEKTWQPCGSRPRHDVLDRAVLARGVQGLEDQQQRAPALGVEALLEVDHALAVLLAQRLGALLGEPVDVAGVAVGEVEAVVGDTEALLEVHVSARPWRGTGCSGPARRRCAAPGR